MRVDIFFWVLILTWLGGSAYCGAIGAADLFQRLGSLGVAIAVLYFAFQKHGVRVPPGFRESSELTIRQIQKCFKEVHVANANTSLMAKALVDQAERAEIDVSPIILSLASIPIDEVKTAYEQPHFEDYEKKLSEITVSQTDADNLVARTLRTSEVFQAFFLVLGTIQWGFGDLLINNICGGSSC